MSFNPEKVKRVGSMQTALRLAKVVAKDEHRDPEDRRVAVEFVVNRTFPNKDRGYYDNGSVYYQGFRVFDGHTIDSHFRKYFN
jgi:hypothetical protein